MIALIDFDSFFVSCQRVFEPFYKTNLPLFYLAMMAVLSPEAAKPNH